MHMHSQEGSVCRNEAPPGSSGGAVPGKSGHSRTLLQRNNNVIVEEVSTVYIFEDRSTNYSNCSAVVTAVWRRGSVLGS